MRRLSPRRQTSSRIVDAHRHGNRFVVREGEKRTLFLELECDGFALRLFEIPLVFERFDHVAASVVNANHDGMRPAVRLCIAQGIDDRV